MVRMSDMKVFYHFYCRLQTSPNFLMWFDWFFISAILVMFCCDYPRMLGFKFLGRTTYDVE